MSKAGTTEGDPTVASCRFSASEGKYELVEHVDSKNNPIGIGGASLNPRFGTFLSCVAIRPSTSSVEESSANLNGAKKQPRFVDVAVTTDNFMAGTCFGQLPHPGGTKKNTIVQSLKKQKSNASNDSQTSNTASASASESTTPQSQKPSGASFIAKMVANERLAQLLASSYVSTTNETDNSADEGSRRDLHHLFINVGKSLIWMDGHSKQQNPLSAIQFKEAIITCHDVNIVTRDTLDCILGFNTGDLLYYCPLSTKFMRLNRSGALLRAGVTCVKWIPGSEVCFMAAFDDGSVMLFDREVDEHSFVIPNSTEFNILHPHFPAKCNPIAYWKVSQKSITGFSYKQHLLSHCLTFSNNDDSFILFTGLSSCRHYIYGWNTEDC